MLAQQPRETGGMSRTSETGETKRETTLLTSHFSRMSCAAAPWTLADFFSILLVAGE